MEIPDEMRRRLTALRNEVTSLIDEILEPDPEHMPDIELSQHLRMAAGWDHDPAMLNVKPIRALLKEGADWHLDVLPMVRQNAHSAKTRGYWTYFEIPIREHWQKRIAPPPITINPRNHFKEWKAWEQYFIYNNQGYRSADMNRMGYYTVLTPFPPEARTG